jgi:hypothetical protein
MPAILVGIFFILHGFVHLLYAGQSLRKFELRPGSLGRMTPGRSRRSFRKRSSASSLPCCWSFRRSDLSQVASG